MRDKKCDLPPALGCVVQKGSTVAMNPSCIREVWTTNVDQEFAVIRRTIEEYSYIGMVNAMCAPHQLIPR